MAMAEDDDLLEACVGHLCFVQPHKGYEPPAFYRRFPRRDYRWKVGAKMKSTPGLQCKLSHSFVLPNCLGLGPDARWRWQGIPIALMTSATVDILPSHQNFTDDVFGGDASFRCLGVRPRARLKALTPLFGNLSLRLMVELLPTPVLVMARQFRLGTTKVTLRASMEVDWHPADTAKLMLQPVKNMFAMQYSRSFKLTPDCKGVASGVAEVPANLMLSGASGLPGSFPAKLRVDSLKLSQVITDKAPKTSPLPTSVYFRASRKIGTSDLISVIPGHWIDPGYEVGAPGERDFNMEVVNVLEKQLRGNGWKVLRPDRECPDLSWEEYLNWVSKQTSKGIPVLEIHGQGSKADYRGLVVGVIGDANAPLNKELAKDFGYFQMDWRDLAVPKRGGVVLESFNSDEVLQMAPWHRKWSVRRLANRITACVERASFENRVSRGIILEDDREDDILALDEKSRKRV